MIEQPNHQTIEPGQTVLPETKRFVEGVDPTMKKGVIQQSFYSEVGSTNLECHMSHSYYL